MSKIYFCVSLFILIFRYNDSHNDYMKTLHEMSSTRPPGHARQLRIREVTEAHWLEIVKARKLQWPWPDIAEALGLPRDAAGPLCTAAFHLRRLISEKQRRPSATSSKSMNSATPSPNQLPCDPKAVEDI
jgi:hypothetical protein